MKRFAAVSLSVLALGGAGAAIIATGALSAPAAITVPTSQGIHDGTELGPYRSGKPTSQMAPAGLYVSYRPGARAHAASVNVKDCTASVDAPTNQGWSWFESYGRVRCNSNHQTLQIQVWMNEYSGGQWWFITGTKGPFVHAGGYAGATAHSNQALVPPGHILQGVGYVNVDGQTAYFSSGAITS